MGGTKQIAASLAAAGLLLAPAAQANWFGSAEANLLYDDNLNRAEASRDIESDAYLDLRLTGGRFMAVGDRGELTLSAELRGEIHDEFSGLNTRGINAVASYRHKLGLGHFAPWFAVGANLGYEDFNDRNRDSVIYGINLRAGKRFESLPNWDFSAVLAWEGRNARDAHPDRGGTNPDRVFDHDAVSLGLNADYIFENGTALTLGYTLRRGDIVSSTSTPLDEIGGPYMNDAVFDGMRTYKLDATSHILAAGLSLPLSDNSSLTGSVQHQTVKGEHSRDYTKNLVRLTYLLAF